MLIPPCKKCGIDISEYEKIKFFGYCLDCYPIKRQALKQKLTFLIFLGLFLILFGIVGVYVTLQDLIIGFSSATTPEELMEFGAALFFSIISIPIIVLFTAFGIHLVKG